MDQIVPGLRPGRVGQAILPAAGLSRPAFRSYVVAARTHRGAFSGYSVQLENSGATAAPRESLLNPNPRNQDVILLECAHENVVIRHGLHFISPDMDRIVPGKRV